MAKDDKFICYGTYSDKVEQCLLTCPFRFECQRLTEGVKSLKNLEAIRKEIEDNYGKCNVEGYAAIG